MDQDTAISKTKDKILTNRCTCLLPTNWMNISVDTLTHPAHCFLKAVQLTWANAPSLLPLHYWMAHETLPPISYVCIMSRNCLYLLCAFAVGLVFFLQALVRCHRKQTRYEDFPSTFFLCPIFVLWLLLKFLCYSYLSFIFFRSSRLTFII